jgi:hypothetical protein
MGRKRRMSNITYDKSITMDVTETNRVTVDTSREGYENAEMVAKVDAIAEGIISKDRKNKYRDKFFPELINALGITNGAEIGVDGAGFSEHILSKTAMTKYYCIDTWMNNFGSGVKMRKSTFDADGDARYQEAQDRLNEFGDRALFMRESSMEAVTNFADNSLDYVYIDGDHSLEGIYDDITSWTSKVRIGGIVAGHDYKDGPGSGIKDFFGEQLPYRIKGVTDDYCRRHGFKLNTVGGLTLSWYFVKNKEA